VSVIVLLILAALSVHVVMSIFISAAAVLVQSAYR